MNHDYAHCADFKPSCPRNCFRAKLERDLRTNGMNYVGIPISYVHFKESGMCQMEWEGEDDENTEGIVD